MGQLSVCGGEKGTSVFSKNHNSMGESFQDYS